MTIRIPHGYTPLKEALNIPSEPCEHCQQGTVILDNGRQFPCVYCDGTGFYDPDELKLARLKMAVVLCNKCDGNKTEVCPDCRPDEDSSSCATCDGYCTVECKACNGFGYLFIDNRDEKERARGYPLFALQYANHLMHND